MVSASAANAPHADGPAHRLAMRLFVASAIICALLLLAYVVICVYLATHLTAARNLPVGTPADVGLVYEPVAFHSELDHITLRGWYLPSSGTRGIILLHGLDGNRWDTNNWLAQLIPVFIHDGFDVLTFDQRAHGESDGEHVGLGTLERGDVRAAVHLVEQRGVQAGHIGLFGQSFGAATALNSTAVISDIAGVASDSAFADAGERLNFEIHRLTGLPPIFAPGVGLASSGLYGIDLSATPEKAMTQIAPRPVLLIHGDADARIPVENAYRLKAATNNPNVELWIVPGAGHTGSYDVAPELYTLKIVTFFERALDASAVLSGS